MPEESWLCCSFCSAKQCGLLVSSLVFLFKPRFHLGVFIFHYLKEEKKKAYFSFFKMYLFKIKIANVSPFRAMPGREKHDEVLQEGYKSQCPLPQHLLILVLPPQFSFYSPLFPFLP